MTKVMKDTALCVIKVTIIYLLYLFFSGRRRKIRAIERGLFEIPSRSKQEASAVLLMETDQAFSNCYITRLFHIV